MEEPILSEIPDAVWGQVSRIIATELSEQSYTTWFKGVWCSSYTPDLVELVVPGKFVAEWLKDRYEELIRSCFVRITQSKPAISYRIESPEPQTPEPIVLPEANATLQTSVVQTHTMSVSSVPDNTSTQLNAGFTFDDFVVGSGNRFAHAAAMAISESPAKSYNPFFVYGPSGLGKTHLLQAIAHEIKKRYPEKKVHYTSSETFTNALISSIHKKTTVEFRQKYRMLDVLIIDDIHFIAGKDSTQEEFFHTFNALYDAKKQIILSSDRPPKEIPALEKRLVSRFEWGLATEIQAPDFETRVAILKKKLEREHALVTDDILFYIAEHITTNIRELEGALVRVCAKARFENIAVTLSLAQQLLQPSVKEEGTKISIDLIQMRVAEAYGLKTSDLRAKKRTKNIAFPRQVAMYLARTLTNHSYPEIGNYFGGRGHATVVHAYNRISSLLAQNDQSAAQIKDIEKKIFKPC